MHYESPWTRLADQIIEAKEAKEAADEMTKKAKAAMKEAHELEEAAKKEAKASKRRNGNGDANEDAEKGDGSLIAIEDKKVSHCCGWV